jgi:NitT/TauT family transport system substrate-binding protein
MTFTRREWLAASLALPAAAALPGLSLAQEAPEKRKVAIAVGGKAGFYYLPLTIAEQLGYFKAEGLDVEISDFAGGAKALQAVVGGSADVVSGAFEHTINLQAKGQHFQCFVLQGRAPQIAVGVSTRTLPNYKGIADLKGKRIGVSAPGSSTNMMANFLLAKAGLKPSDVSFIGVGTSAGAISAMRSGQIDAISNIEPAMTMLQQKGDVKIIADTRTLKGTQELLGGPMPAACLYAPADFVQKYPNTVQALANAIVRALKWLENAGPSELVKTVPESYLLGDRALYLATFGAVREALSIDGMVSEEAAKTALKVLQEFEPSLRTAKIDLSKLYTNEFAKRANAKFKTA